MDSFDFESPDVCDGVWYGLGISARRNKKTRGLPPKKERKGEFGTKKLLKMKELR